MEFKKAVKRRQRLRLALDGVGYSSSYGLDLGGRPLPGKKSDRPLVDYGIILRSRHPFTFLVELQTDRVDFPEGLRLISEIGIVQVIVKSFRHGLSPPPGHE